MEEDYKEEIEALWRISQLISKAWKPQQIISGITKEAAKILRADAASIRFLGKENLILAEGYGLSREYKAKVSLKIGEGLVGMVAQQKKLLFSDDIQKDPRIFYPEINKKEGIVSIICAPILVEDKLIGTFTVYSKKRRAWTEREAKILSRLAEQLVFSLEKIRYIQILKERSIRDELTGLYSRSYFLTRAKEEIIRSFREGNYLSFLFCDIDDFRSINRIQGYAEGDKVLCQVAKIIKSSLRREDILCRYGGDEFAILLPKADSFLAVKIAERVHQAFTRKEEVKNYPSLGISIGIASYPIHGKFIEDILAKADRSMIFAKHHPERKTFVWDEWKITDVEKIYKKEGVSPEVIYSLAKTVNMKNGYTGEHFRFVAEQALLLAKKIGLEKERIKRIKIAAFLHDTGKLIIPTELLNKPTPLTQEEWKIVKKHAEDSAKIASCIKDLEEIAPIIRAIHERWDGKGYPDGLAGDKIPFEARIIALVDTYQALISDRPYRKRLSKQEAIKELQEESGKQFDPKLVEAFLKILI